MIVAVVIIVYAVTGFKFGYYTGQVSAPVNIPVANISVTDGKNVVKTDEKGCFEKSDFSTHRAITDCFSAVSRAVRKFSTTRLLFMKCSTGKMI